MLELIEPKLIQRARLQDPKVVGEIYERYQLAIFRFLYYRVGDLQTAEDLTSEVFIRMIKGLPEYTHDKFSFKAWLFRIARNLSIDHYRSSNRRKEIELDEDQIPNHDNPLDHVEQGLTNEKLSQALNKLPTNQRDVIVMRFVNGMSIREVAQVMNRSQDSIKGLQRRALIALRDILTEWEVSNVGIR